MDKNKFLAVASCSRKEFQGIVDIMMEYNPGDDNGKYDNMMLCTLITTLGSHDTVVETEQPGNITCEHCFSCLCHFYR